MVYYIVPRRRKIVFYREYFADHLIVKLNDYKKYRTLYKKVLRIIKKPYFLRNFSLFYIKIFEKHAEKDQFRLYSAKWTRRSL